MDRQVRADGQYPVPHLTPSSPQFEKRPGSERLTAYQEGDKLKLHMNSQTPQIESGYSSMASSQNYPTSSDLEHGVHRHEKLQPLVDASIHENITSGGSSDIRSTCTISPPINQLPQLKQGASKDCIVDRAADGLGRDSDIPGPPVLQIAPPLPPTLMAHPNSLGRGGLVSSPPTTPPKIQNTADPIISNALISLPSTSPAAIAGAKRTSSGTVKSAVAVSVSNSPTEVVVYAPSLNQGGPLTVDAGRIQELSAQLRARLKYARIKVDNNWTTKSLEQVESIYHSNQSSPSRGERDPGIEVKHDSPEGTSQREKELTDFGPPIHVLRHAHGGTASEAVSHSNDVAVGVGLDSAKTYESFWKEKPPFTTKMLEKMSTTTGGVVPHDVVYEQQGDYQQYAHNDRDHDHDHDHDQHHHHYHHRPQCSYHQPQQQRPLSQVKPLGQGDNGKFPSYQQQATYSSGHHGVRPPPLTPSHSNLSNYSTTCNDDIPPPTTPLRLSHQGSHPTLSRGTSSKSAEEEAVESLMFLMSSPGNNSTRGREPRVPAYRMKGSHEMPRRGSILSRENSNGVYGNRELDLDVTDAEDISANGLDDTREEGLVLVHRGGAGESEEGTGYPRRRSNSSAGRYDSATSRIKSKHTTSGRQERVSKHSAGTPGKEAILGIDGMVGNLASQASASGRRLAPGFSPS